MIRSSAFDWSFKSLRQLFRLALGAWLILLLIPLGISADPDSMPQAVNRPDPSSWSVDALTISNLGHATLLFNFFGVRAISDPSFYDRVGFALDGITTIGPKRQVPAPLTPAEVGPLDVILITHAHMDHLDLRSLKALPKSATVIACDECSDLIAPLGYRDVRELKWGDSTEVKGIKVTAFGAKHWGNRWPKPFGKARGYNSYLIEGKGHRMLLGCDSAFTDKFAALKANPPEVAVFSIGAYDPWIASHANPEQVWQMFKQTGAQWLIPIHWGTFRLSREPLDEPLKRLNAAAGSQSDRIVMQSIGATWSLPTASARTAAR
ncbi:MAG TPA: MBL fold metallo-hydrolase [Candidatus Binataceae bacterium]